MQESDKQDQRLAALTLFILFLFIYFISGSVLQCDMAISY